MYAKHGWLVFEDLRIKGLKGPTEARWDRELKGYGWETAMLKAKEHAENHIGPCDIQEAGNEYPLVRIADIIANFTRWHLVDGLIENGEPAVLNRLRSKTAKMWLEVSEDFRMSCE